jgi:hypothetical protein
VLEHELEKEFGVNYFQIALPSPWKYDEVFQCELLNEEGKKYTASIRWVLPEVEPVEASIKVNPKYIECDSPQGNLVEYYARITGGQPPYQVNWYVLNEQRTQLLYYPRSEKIKEAGISPSIEVDRAAKYSVLLYVKDACGTESKRAVTLTCDNGQKQINSIMFEPIDHSTLPPVKAGN